MTTKHVRIPKQMHGECVKAAMDGNAAGLRFSIGDIVAMAITAGLPTVQKSIKAVADIKGGRPRK